MKKTMKIVTVFVEKDQVSCECVCAIPTVTVGDYVKIFLNNAPVEGIVKEEKEIAMSELSDAVYEMKSVIAKVRRPIAAEAEKNTIRVSEVFSANRLVTLFGRDIRGRAHFAGAELEANAAEIGDTLLFSTRDGTSYSAEILSVDDTAYSSMLEYRVDAVIKRPKNTEFLKNKININQDEHKVTLLSFTLPHTEYIIDSILTNIGERAFERCRKLKHLTIATGGIFVEPMAFSYNNSIEEIHICDERAAIAINCFDGCRKLRHVILPYTLYYLQYELSEYYGDRIEFTYALGRNLLTDGVVYSEDLQTIICCVDEEIKEFQSPLEVRTVRSKAFLNCKKLEYFTASPLTENLESGSLAGCMALKEVSARFEDDLDPVLLFGTDFCENSVPKELQRKDGRFITFYLPKSCTFHSILPVESLAKTLNPCSMPPQVFHLFGEYFYEHHNIKEAIRLYMVAARQGLDRSYQRLAAYSYNDIVGRQYFTVDQYDYAHRLLTIKPFFRMLSFDFPEYKFEDLSDSEILHYFTERSRLVRLLKDIEAVKFYDLDLLAIALNAIFIQTEDLHDMEIKRLFLRCANKLGLFEMVPGWKDELLDELFQNGADQDFREFGFEVITMTDYLPKPEKDMFLKSMPDSETKDCLSLAHAAAMAPAQGNINTFEKFLHRFKETGDMFYQKCAVVSIFSYLALCKQEKVLTAQFRSTLELVQQKYEEGFVLLGKLILGFKENMKRSIPKRYYFECAERMYDAGLLYVNSFDNIIGKNVQRKAAYYARYPEYFDITDQHTFIMEEFNKSHFFIPGSFIAKTESSKDNPVMFKNYRPELVGGELMIFLNPHEGLTCAQKNGYPIPDDYYRVSLGQVFSAMQYFHLSEARVFPQILNRKITKEYIKSIFDGR